MGCVYVLQALRVVEDVGKLILEALFLRRRQAETGQVGDVSNLLEGEGHDSGIIAEGPPPDWTGVAPTTELLTYGEVVD